MRKRTQLVLVGVVVVLGAGAVTTVVLSGGVGGSCGIPESVAEEPVSAASAPGGGGIRVVEKGFSHEKTTVSMGAVVRNTSSRIAYRTKVAFKVTVSAEDDPSSRVRRTATTEIPVIMPGRRVGIGRGVVPGFGGRTSVTVDRQTTTWLPPDALGEFTPTKTTHQRVDTSYAYPSVHYIEKSANCRDLSTRGTSVVFRDSSGAIVGGGFAFPDGKSDPAASEKEPPTSRSCSPGRRETWIVPPTGIPPKADEKRTELYSYCDLNAPPADVNSSR